MVPSLSSGQGNLLNKEVIKIATFAGGIRSLAIGSDERCRTLYASSWDTTVSVIDSVTLKITAVLAGHEDTASGVAVDSNYV